MKYVRWSVDQDSAQVRVPPPLILLGALAFAAGLQQVAPWHGAWGGLGRSLGIALCLACLALGLACMRRFAQAATHIEPWKTSSALVISGPYRVSRNPIYAAMVLFSAGLGLALDNVWMILGAVPLQMALRAWVISREEKYLAGKFGQAYFDYCRQVRRWL
jgi:protein-S-isoprenylcysteine O-methyltransferase Ste14